MSADRRLRQLAIVAVATLLIIVSLLVLRVDAPLIEAVIVRVFALVTFIGIPFYWFQRELARHGEMGRLPGRYRIIFYGILAAAVAIFVAFMWYTVSHGLTKLW